jgi:regulatory protein
MTGQRRARTGRGWDAAPPRARPRADDPHPDAPNIGGRRIDGRHPDEPNIGGPHSRDPEGVGRHIGGPNIGGPNIGGPNIGGPNIGGLGAEKPRTGGRAGPRWGTEASKPTDPADQAREICLRLLSFRPRTRAELASALHQKGIADEVAAEVLDRYGEVGIIDDEAFARAWVSSRHHGRGLARRALAGELRRKGVESETVGAALDDLDPEIEADTARTLVERKLRSDRGGPPEALFRRLVGMLARKGYPAGLAFRVVKDVLAERADAAALEAAELDVSELDTDLLDAEARAAEAAADAEAHESE